MLQPLDPGFSLLDQLSIPASPVVLINLFTLDPADEPRFLEVWRDDAAFMQAQPGFLGTQLHRALGPNPTYLNRAVWASTLHFGAAFGQAAFQAKLDAYPPSAMARPHLFQTVAIPGICAA